MEPSQPQANGKCWIDPPGSTNTENVPLSSQENGKNLMTDPGPPARETWSRKLDFILSCTGFAVGLGNIWRFPYLCYKNGGGAFLVPYMIFMVCAGIPLFFLEVALGQFMSKGGIGAWGLVPIFKGIGIATTVMVSMVNIYYIIILAWDMYYCVMSFTSVLPWSHCNNTWNTERCIDSFCNNATQNCSNASYNLPPGVTPVDPVVEFWENKILQISPGIDQPNGLVWELALALAVIWLLCYFCVWKGVKWSGKVVYFTATFPYIVLTILIIRGITLEGAGSGIKFYLYPDFKKLANAQVWIDAGTQIFYSYALALGAMTALGSYNKFNNNCYRDCVIISCINSSTSLFAGFAIFSILGFMANQQGVDIDKVAESGPGLAFIAYPKAVAQMPASPFWAVLFFFMIILLGLDSQFVGVEAFFTVVMDLFPQLRKGWNREIFVALYCMFSFLVGLSMCTRGGMYVFQIFDYYSASGLSLLWVCFFECISLAWVYGAKNFYDNVELMVGFRISPWLRICWTYLTPLLTMGIMVFMWVQYEPLVYNRTYHYPTWALVLGLGMALASMVCIPVYLVVSLFITQGTLKERWTKLTTPKLQPHQIPDHWKDTGKFKVLLANQMYKDELLKVSTEKENQEHSKLQSSVLLNVD